MKYDNPEKLAQYEHDDTQEWRPENVSNVERDDSAFRHCSNLTFTKLEPKHGGPNEEV